MCWKASGGMRRSASWILGISSVFLIGTTSCDDGPEPDVCDPTYALLSGLALDRADFPAPIIDGTRFTIRGQGFITDRSCVTPQIALVGGGREVTVPLSGTPPDMAGTISVLSSNDIVATLPASAINTLGGAGTFSGNLEVRFLTFDGRVFSASLPLSFLMANTLEPGVFAVTTGTTYLNDAVPVEGTAFLDDDGEGTTEIVIDGTFERDDGGEVSVNGITMPLSLVTPTERQRGTFRWSPVIGGVSPGTFTGTLTPQNRHGNGSVIRGTPTTVTLEQEDSVVFGISDEVISLGQLVDVTGRGFIGTTELDGGENEGLTTLRLDGEFAPCTGGGGSGLPLNCNNPPIQVSGLDLFTNFSSGSLLRYPLVFSNNEGMLQAVDFESQRGTFEGTVTPVLILDSEVHEGIPRPNTSLELGPVRQICWVLFLPGFSDSLRFFGLEAVEHEIRARVLTQMQEVYQPTETPSRWLNVEFRAEEPQDFFPGGYALVEIGGPDPNNIGLFGYDNTPGKDIGNLRLEDHVGGRNALGEVDGYGYGGVFVESMLFWSEHPPSELGARPRGSPPSHPSFDVIFDPVRDNEVVAGEWPNGASPERLAEIEAAISFISNMIADTAAHEFGHSLGLAQPFVPNEAYHNAIPQEGCLMDAGRDRPLEERSRIEGNLGSRFCQENLWYLQDILPME